MMGRLLCQVGDKLYIIERATVKVLCFPASVARGNIEEFGSFWLLAEQETRHQQTRVAECQYCSSSMETPASAVCIGSFQMQWIFPSCNRSLSQDVSGIILLIRTCSVDVNLLRRCLRGSKKTEWPWSHRWTPLQGLVRDRFPLMSWQERPVVSVCQHLSWVCTAVPLHRTCEVWKRLNLRSKSSGRQMAESPSKWPT